MENKKFAQTKKKKDWILWFQIQIMFICFLGHKGIINYAFTRLSDIIRKKCLELWPNNCTTHMMH